MQKKHDYYKCYTTIKKQLPDKPPISVTVSLDRQKDINRNSSVTELIYLKTINVIFNNKGGSSEHYTLLSTSKLTSPLTRTYGKS